MPYFRVNPVAATEGAGFVDFVISLDQASTNEIRVNYDTDIGTATYGSNQPDYLRAFGTLVYAPGQTSQTLRVTLVANTLPERTELFWLDLTSPVNATIARFLDRN